MTIQKQPPDVLAMLVADAIHRDVATGKYFIQGTFNKIHPTGFPYTHPLLVVYTALTEGYGETDLRLLLVDVDETRAPLFVLKHKVSFADPIEVIELPWVSARTVFPAPGEYRLQLFGAGELLKERRLQVQQGLVM